MKKFEEMNLLEKNIYNTKQIIVWHEEAIVTLKKAKSPLIPMLSLQREADSQKRFLAELEAKLAEGGTEL